MKVQFLLLCLILASCSSGDQSLKNDNAKMIQEVFTSNEINDLQKVVDFFGENACKATNTPSSDLATCYQAYLKRYHDLVNVDTALTLKISFPDQEKLLASMDQNFVKSLWYTHPDSTSKLGYYISTFRPDGKLLKLMYIMGNKDELMRAFYATHEALDDTFSPSMIQGMADRYEQFEFTQPEVQLILAAYFLGYNHHRYLSYKNEREYLKKRGGKHYQMWLEKDKNRVKEWEE